MAAWRRSPPRPCATRRKRLQGPSQTHCTLFPHSTPTELDELFLEADADGDGSLSRDEFAAAMTFDWGTLCACSFSGSDDGSSSCASGAEAATPMGAALAGCRPVGAADVGVLPTAPAAAMAGVKL